MGCFLINVVGTSPHAINHWRAYRALPQAKAQVTRMLPRRWAGRWELYGDWKGTIYYCDPQLGTMAEVA